jgi:cellulose synthase/poly-beta-1,6-N-acetylglucosamine synthase-like glycosyltransferase
MPRIKDLKSNRVPRVSERKDWPKISLVTPNYNGAHTLEKTVCSVLQQEYPNLEYIVIDGGPTPGGLPSTIVDVTGREVKILREGAISKESLSRSSGWRSVSSIRFKRSRLIALGCFLLKTFLSSPSPQAWRSVLQWVDGC